ncbi:MAG: RsmE family RNA methyltransferase [Candidatus Pacebacteria bacterium]|nr:RsmE family RNA methyltransferase [Candidatus Paceibacterota bacterium]
MRLHRFYIEQKIDDLGIGDELTVSSPALLHQWRNVFRFRPGVEVLLFDGRGFEYRTVFHALEKKGASLEIVDKINKKNERKDGGSEQSEPVVWLFAAVVKKDNFEWIVEKATELGVDGVVPVVSERSEKKSLNEERLKKIVIEASEQSGRVILPEVLTVVSLTEALALVKEKKMQGVAFDPTGENLRNFENKNKINTLNSIPVAVFVGPEGGWTEKELELFKKESFDVVSLGSQILRAETAAIAGIVAISLAGFGGLR